MRAPILRTGIAGFALAAAAMLSIPAFAETVNLKADLKGGNEVPPVTGNASGNATVAYDSASKKLTWTVNYSGLSGNVTGAHFHGPAAPDKNAGVAVPMKGDLTKSPIKGDATLTDAQAAQLMAGQ